MAIKMFLTHFLALTILVLSASAESKSFRTTIIDCFEDEDNRITFEVNDEKVTYSSVESYFKYEPKAFAVTKYPSSNIVTFVLGESYILLKGTDDKNFENSVKSLTPVRTIASGVGHLYKGEMTDCSVSLSEDKSASHRNVPEEFKNEIFKKVSNCLQAKLCQAIGPLE